MNWITNAVLPKIKALVTANDVPDNLWVKCKSCGQMIFHREFEQANNCCSTCGHHAPLPPKARFAMTFDKVMTLAKYKAFALYLPKIMALATTMTLA